MPANVAEPKNAPLFAVDPPTTAVCLPREAIAAFCSRWGVSEMSLFGSVLRDDFGPESDVDVLVTFAEGVEFTLDSYFDMQDDLQRLFGRPVDLIDRDAFEREHRNPLRRRAILDSAKVVHRG